MSKHNRMIVAGEDLSGLQEKALASARKIADWLLASQKPEDHYAPESGTYFCDTGRDEVNYYACNWNLAFAIMGLFSAHKVFGEEKYRTGALRMARYLKSLQIFSPFLPECYGAFREMSPQTPWFYVRDNISAAWAMIELYRETGEREYLTRALLWYQWFRKYGMDPSGWPYWGKQFEPAFAGTKLRIFNHLHGCFHGGSLNFFYQLFQVTGNEEYVSGFYTNIADKFIHEIQQADGFFRSVNGASGKVPENDPQQGLHRGNDDLGTLGLAGAYKLTGDPEYLRGIERFFNAVFARQGSDGGVETSCAADPVILNAVYETQELPLEFRKPAGALSKLLEHLFARQIDDPEHPLLHGGFDEVLIGRASARSGCYALIVLLKIFGGGKDYLSV